MTTLPHAEPAAPPPASCRSPLNMVGTGALVLTCVLGALGLGFLGTASAQSTSILINSGPPQSRIDIVIVAEAYTTAQMPVFRSDAADLIARFWDYEPYKSYRSAFNVRLLETASASSSVPKNGQPGNTAYGAFYNCSGERRLICVNNSRVLSDVQARFRSLEADFILVLVNDTEYGGSGGTLSVTSKASAAALIAIHEFGHTIADLADEYSSAVNVPGCGSQCPEANVQTRPPSFTPANIKWSRWLTPGVRLPTSPTPRDFVTIGFYEGARYQTTGIFRPKVDCLMRSLAAAPPPAGPGFCQICSEAHALRFLDIVSPLEPYVANYNGRSWGGTAPASAAAPIALNACDSRRFDIETTLAQNPSITWRLSNASLATQTPRYTVSAAQLGDGNHTLTASVIDSTPLIRQSTIKLRDERTWALRVSGVGAGVCTIGGTCVATGAQAPGLPCRVCDPARNRTDYSQTPRTCFIEGRCVAEGEAAPNRPCLTCQPSVNVSDWTQRSNTCLVGERCYEQGELEEGTCGACEPSLAPRALTYIDMDGDGQSPTFCGGTDCDDTNPEVFFGAGELRTQPGRCEDGIDNDCNGLIDAADPGCQTCAQSSDCDDGVFCNGLELCLAGSCQPGTPPECRDAFSCTVAECDFTVDACTFDRSACPPCLVDQDCDDGVFCNGQERCIDGFCGGGTAPVCDDGNSCTLNECREDLGRCQTIPIDAPACADGNAVNCECSVATPRDLGATCFGLLLLLAYLRRRAHRVTRA